MRQDAAPRRVCATLPGLVLVVAVAALSLSLGLPMGPTHATTARRTEVLLSRASPIAAPPGVYAATMVYDVADGYLLLFGGTSAYAGFGGSNETWAFRNGSWTQLHPAISPAGRMWAMMAYDAADGYVVLFGGSNVSQTIRYYHDLGDTWIFQAGNWTRANLTVHPGARDSGMMAYDSTDGYVLLFGGAVDSHTRGPRLQNSTVFLNDTWSFSHGAWHKLSTRSVGGALPPRAQAILSDNPPANDVLIIGGLTKSGTAVPAGTAQIWAYSNTTWTDVGKCLVTVNLSNIYCYAADGALAFDPLSGRLVMFGTSGQVQPYCAGRLDSWTLARSQGASKVMLDCQSTPSYRLWPSMAYDPADGYMVLFGGNGLYTSFLNDTWALYGGAWHAV